VSDFTNFRAVYDELTDEVSRARHQFFLEHLSNWFQLIDETPGVSSVVKALAEGHDVDLFLKESEATMGSFVGSGTLLWPKDSKQRLGMKLAVFRSMAEEKIDALDFSHNFSYVDKYHDANISALSDQIFMPMARDLRRYLERLDAAGELDAIPASDRVVTLDHNSQKYKDVMQALETLEKALRGDNALYDDPELKDRHLAETSALQRLLKALQIKTILVFSIVGSALFYIAKKAADSTIGKLAVEAIEKLRSLIDIAWPF
jgi:hypothetical protein